MKKTVNLIVPGADPENLASHRQIVLLPETTVRDVLIEQNLQGYDLSLGPNKPFLGQDDILYEMIDANGKIYATTQAIQGVDLENTSIMAKIVRSRN